MATAAQVQSLIKSYVTSDDNNFQLTVQQILDYENEHKHFNSANTIKTILRTNPQTNKKTYSAKKANRIINNPLIEAAISTVPKNKLVTSEAVESFLQELFEEYKNSEKLRQRGLCNKRKILLEGPPGTGKTMTASIIASKLHLPLYKVQTHHIINSKMGATAVQLNSVFQLIQHNTGVYLFDEFESIGKSRPLINKDQGNADGEMSRVLDSLLQFIENDDSESIILAATNTKYLLDKALFRRFDDVIHYELPNNTEIKQLYKQQFQNNNDAPVLITDKIIEQSKSLCQADIVRICDNAKKYSILHNKPINEMQILRFIDRQKKIYEK